MDIDDISLHELRKMNDCEGLVLQGCGGDLQEWVNGINDMLTESGILQNESRFEKAYTFLSQTAVERFVLPSFMSAFFCHCLLSV